MSVLLVCKLQISSPRPNLYEIPDTPLTKLMITFVMCGKDDQHVDTKEEDNETLEPESHETLCADEEEPGGRVAVYQLVGSLQIASLEASLASLTTVTPCRRFERWLYNGLRAVGFIRNIFKLTTNLVPIFTTNMRVKILSGSIGL